MVRIYPFKSVKPNINLWDESSCRYNDCKSPRSTTELNSPTLNNAVSLALIYITNFF